MDINPYIIIDRIQNRLYGRLEAVEESMVPYDSGYIDGLLDAIAELDSVEYELTAIMEKN